MKILIYTTDTVGIKSIVDDIANSFKKMGVDYAVSDKLDYNNFDVVNIHFDYSQFHTWGLGLIPKIIKLKLKNKKVVLTIGTILSKKDTYTRNKFLTPFKIITLQVVNLLYALFTDKITVMVADMKENLVKDYHVPKSKVEVIPHGVY